MKPFLRVNEKISIYSSRINETSKWLQSKLYGIEESAEHVRSFARAYGTFNKAIQHDPVRFNAVILLFRSVRKRSKCKRKVERNLDDDRFKKKGKKKDDKAFTVLVYFFKRISMREWVTRILLNASYRLLYETMLSSSFEASTVKTSVNNAIYGRI